MKKIVIANWKMNPAKLSEARKIVENTKKISKNNSVDIVVCPPFVYMNLLLNSKRPYLGAQNTYTDTEGAYTGEVSPPMLKSVGAAYAIVGHSERRGMGETSEMVAKKAVLCLANKINPIICIGEKVRDNSAEHWQEIKWQLIDSLRGISKSNISKCVIAYEPVWAIGSKSKGAMSPADVAESTIYIKKVMAEVFGPGIADKVRIVYGGSVDSKSAESIMSSSSISGFLVGRASLNTKEFKEIVAVVSQKR